MSIDTQNPIMNFFYKCVEYSEKERRFMRTPCSEYCQKKWEKIKNNTEVDEASFKKRCLSSCDLNQTLIEWNRRDL